MNIFVFDNTFEGLLTSVFEAYSRRVFPGYKKPDEEKGVSDVYRHTPCSNA